jgi:hypothetical protein
MSDNRVIKPMYVDTEACEIKGYKNSAFTTLSPEMSLFRGTQVLFEAHLMMADGTTYIATPTGATWLFGIDDTYTRDHADLVTVANDQFIAADWPGETGADFANGKVCWRCDLTGAALETSLGALASKPMYCGLWMLPAGGAYTLMCQWNITMKNIAVEPA